MFETNIVACDSCRRYFRSGLLAETVSGDRLCEICLEMAKAEAKAAIEAPATFTQENLQMLEPSDPAMPVAPGAAYHGLSVREHFAVQALAGLCAGFSRQTAIDNGLTVRDLALIAVAAADALVAALNAKPVTGK